mgnify:CR=1 FL=1
MPKLKKVFMWLSIIIVVFVGLAWFLLNGFVGSMCANELVTSVTAPNKLFKAVVFKRGCGATTRSSIQVSIKFYWSPFSNREKGNVFTVDSAGPIEIKWEDSRLLQISYPGDGEIFKSCKNHLGINIIYKPIMSAPAVPRI